MIKMQAILKILNRFLEYVYNNFQKQYLASPNLRNAIFKGAFNSKNVVIFNNVIGTLISREEFSTSLEKLLLIDEKNASDGEDCFDSLLSPIPLGDQNESDSDYCFGSLLSPIPIDPKDTKLIAIIDMLDDNNIHNIETKLIDVAEDKELIASTIEQKKIYADIWS